MYSILNQAREEINLILKWPGGKSGLISQLQQLFPKEFNMYYEPFFGGGAVFFKLAPKKSVINDVNATLMSTYSEIKKEPTELINLLEKIEKEYLSLDEESRKDYFYEKRDEYNRTKNKLMKSALLIFLNRTCFNGMYRENKKGDFNVPIGSYKNPKILHTEKIIAASKLLEGSKIISGSYVDAVKDANKGDFVYFDPPYFPLNGTSNFTSYSKDGFNADDQYELAELFMALHKRGCKVMLSNSKTDFISGLYKDFHQETVLAGRNINSKVAKRNRVEELVIRNYEN